MPFDEEDLDPHGECRHEIERLRAALKPFARAAEMFAWPVFAPDGHKLPGTNITAGDLRAARTVLKQ